MAGKTPGHGRKVVVPAKPKPRPLSLGPTHAGRRKRAASKHRTNQTARHEAKKQRRKALGGGKDYVR